MTKAILLGAGVALVLIVLGAGAVLLVRSGGDRDRTTPSGLAGERTTPELEDHSTQGLDVAERAARGFLAGYLPLVYGQPAASVGALRNAAPRLVAQLRADPGRVTPAQAEQTPSVAVVSVVYVGPSRVVATAQILERPSGFRYPFVFRMSRDAVLGWIVTRLGAN